MKGEILKSRKLSKGMLAVLLTVLFFVLTVPHLSEAKNRSENKKGCLSCHSGIEVINKKMQPFLLAFAEQVYGKGEGYECAICHEGNPSVITKKEAHRGLIPNPSSMWVLHRAKAVQSVTILKVV